MILVQLVYLRPGQQATFDAFEDTALARVVAHGGEILARLRAGPVALIAGSLEPPDEVHIISFPDRDAFARYAADPERQRVLHLKDAAVRTTWLIEGERIA